MSAETAAPTRATPDLNPFYAAAQRVIVAEDRLEGTKERSKQYNDVLEFRRLGKEAAPAVVVVGEVGRGKSTLINALLGDDTSPSGPGETTGTYIAFEPASDELPDGSADLELTDGRRKRITTAELGDWIRVGELTPGEAGDAVAIGARVGVAEPPFERTTIVDTPGSGGLNEAHARVAIGRAATASVLVMVTDSSGVMSRQALTFLEHCSAFVASVVIVMTKIDLVPDSWQTIERENRRVLRSSDVTSLHTAPIVAVSAHDLQRSARAATPERAARMRELSRFDELRRVVSKHLERGVSLIEANAVRRLEVVLHDIARGLEQDAAAVAAVAAVERPKQDLERLTAAKQQGRSWRLLLDRDIANSRREVAVEVTRRLTELQTAWEERLDKMRWGATAKVAQRIHVDMTAEIYTAVEDLRLFAAQNVTARLAALLESLDLPGDGAVISLSDNSELVALRTLQESHTPFDVGLLMAGFSGLRMASGLVGIAPIAALLGPTGWIVGGVVGLVGGGVLVGVNLLCRGLQKQQANLKMLLQRTVGDLRGAVLQELDERIGNVRPDLIEFVESALTASIAELTRRVTTINEAARRTEQQRRDQADELSTRASAARTASSSGDALRRQLVGA